MQADGYSLDDKRNKIADSDLPDIVEKYRLRTSPESVIDRKQKHFSVPKEEIIENNYDLNLSTYKEEVYEEVVYEKPEVIFEKLEQLEKEIHHGINELKKLI